MKVLKNIFKAWKKKSRIKLLFLGLAVFFFSCSSGSYLKLKLELPGKKVIDLDAYEMLILTNFYVKKETKDINLSSEIVSFLETELKRKFEGEVISREIMIEKEEVLEDEGFWKNASLGSKDSLLITGTASYSEEIRKALIEKRPPSRYEEPFPPEKGLAERKFYSLSVDFYLVDPESGKILFKKNFKETQSYRNPNQTAYFAFFDLIRKVKTKLFRNFFGESMVEERYLIYK